MNEYLIIVRPTPVILKFHVKKFDEFRRLSKSFINNQLNTYQTNKNSKRTESVMSYSFWPIIVQQWQ